MKCKMRLSPIVLSAATAWLNASPSWCTNVLSSPNVPYNHNNHSDRQMRENVVDSVSIAAYRNDDNPSAELSTEFFLLPNIGDKNDDMASVASVISVPTANRTITIFRGNGGNNRVVHGDGIRTRNSGFPLDEGARNSIGTGAPGTVFLNNQSLLRQRSWALPLAALSAAAMLLMAGFEIFVLLKARAAAPSRRHLFLGQALLLGLFLLAGLSAAASLTPNPLTCAAFRLVGLPAALVFAALLVKCVFLLSLNSGVYLPAPYQALVLVFAVLVQVAIVGQWFYGEFPSVVQPRNNDKNSSNSFCCKTPLSQTVASLGYPGLLLIGVACLAVRARGVRDNYREAAFIGLAVGLTLPIWITSAIGSLASAESDREAWLAYGLLTTALLVFLSMFLPKGRQLAALGRDGQVAAACTAVIRERDDRLSSLPASGYSPSFFHFKPGEGSLKRKMHYQSAGCNACRHGGSPVYSEAEVHTPIETFVLPPGMYLQRPELEAANLYTTISANPNVFFQRAHPGMMY
ncbi:uncharacterized protein [Venturia canescens]|uniref:uncharacterized protein isoform X2 n=1 Tax=Venturia canescens TaxID=32260 RepID=UPI001C9BC0AF|nr:uncharacterized protein LOC122409952 isoform X2 [Venturia canescens]